MVAFRTCKSEPVGWCGKVHERHRGGEEAIERMERGPE